MDASKPKLSTSIPRNQRFCKPERNTNKNNVKNAVPILAYYDIFKNFYANTQEDNFYIIGTSAQLSEIQRVVGGNVAKIPLENPYIIEQDLQYKIKYVENSETGESIIIKWQAKAGGTINETTLDKITKEKPTVTGRVITFTANINNLGAVGEYIRIYSIQSKNTTALRNIPLENLDTIRDKILMTAGDTIFNISNETNSVEPFTLFTKRESGSNRLYSTTPQFGLCLKTYNSDQYQNWINTEWIEGVNGINEASAVDVSGGTLSMDALNLSQKVYNFLNRIAISGGRIS